MVLSTPVQSWLILAVTGRSMRLSNGRSVGVYNCKLSTNASQENMTNASQRSVAHQTSEKPDQLASLASLACTAAAVQRLRQGTKPLKKPPISSFTCLHRLGQSEQKLVTTFFTDSRMGGEVRTHTLPQRIKLRIAGYVF